MQKSDSFITLRAAETVAWNVPALYRDATVDECPKSVQWQIRRWLDRPGPGLWLWGKSESGKSKAATAIALELFRRGQNLRVMTYRAWFAWLRDRRKGLLSDIVLDALIAPSVLVLDEISHMFFHWPLAADLGPVFRARVEAKKPTIISSNIDVADYITFCDSQASDYLSGFLSLKFPHGMAWPADWTALANGELAMYVREMIELGWLTPEVWSTEVPRRLARLKLQESLTREY